jgi:anaerobic ribonucleoside-triphosphate reductase activating protein
MNKQSTLTLNIAEIWPATRALGPGLRAVVWVQGCPFHCPGCISPEWTPDIPAKQFHPEELAYRIFSQTPDIDGITISGGEPMAQALALAAFVRYAHQIKRINIISFTGYKYEDLCHYPANSGVQQYLEQLDVLIDGPYVENLNDNKGMRGSSNQRIIHISNRLKHYNFTESHRRVEIQVQDEYVMMIGVPPTGILDKLRSIFDKKESPQTGLEGDKK